MSGDVRAGAARAERSSLLKKEQEQPLEVCVMNRQRRVDINLRKVTAFVRRASALAGVSAGEVEVLFCGLDRIRQLNRDYRNVDRPTDVLSFPDAPPFLGGMIIIAPSVPLKTCPSSRQLDEELALLLVHGLLHLAGMDHPEAHVDETEMGRRQREILARLPAAERRGLVVSTPQCNRK